MQEIFLKGMKYFRSSIFGGPNMQGDGEGFCHVKKRDYQVEEFSSLLITQIVQFCI
jgi:hypothetical protein